MPLKRSDRRNKAVSIGSNKQMKRLLITAITICMAIVSIAFSQSPQVFNQQEDLDSALITATDWESLKHVDVVDDDCDFAKSLESCETTFPKPKTTAETRRIIVADECNSAAKVLAAYKPCYPTLARAANVSGPIEVIVVVDERGFVVWAHAWKGHPLLQSAAVKAACKWRFEPARCSGGFQTVNRMISFGFEGAR